MVHVCVCYVNNLRRHGSLHPPSPDRSLQGSSESAPSTTAQRLNVWSVDISNQGGGAFTQVYLGNGTERAIRARHPNGNPETTGLQTKPSGYIDGAVGWWKPAPFAQAYNIEIASPNRTDS